MLRIVIVALVLAAVAPVRAEGTKIAVIENERFYVKGGITRWLTARAKLDEERKKFRLVESPDGKPAQPPEICKDKADWAKALCKDWTKRDHEIREDKVWEEHETAVLDPIEEEIRRALEQFAKARRIDLILDKQSISAHYIGPGIDVTDAFIREINARPVPKRQ